MGHILEPKMVSSYYCNIGSEPCMLQWALIDPPPPLPEYGPVSHVVNNMKGSLPAIFFVGSHSVIRFVGQIQLLRSSQIQRYYLSPHGFTLSFWMWVAIHNRVHEH